MYTGPNLQQDLQSLILRWRQFHFGYTADIQAMFRNIDLLEEDQPLQKIVWRDSPDEPLRTYQLTTVTYGMKPAPFLAMMTLRRLAADERHKFPTSSKIVEQSFYTDDLIHGSHSIEAGTKTVMELQELLQASGFILRKWSSNEPEILNSITSKQNIDDPVFKFKCEHTAKTLGLYWSPKEDIFMFQSSFEFSNNNFNIDPLGWLAPATIKLKLLFQQVWSTKTQWNDKLPDHITKQWEECKIDISTNIILIKIPRWLKIIEKCVVEHHGFCDNSNKAYGCVIYSVVNHIVTIVVSLQKDYSYRISTRTEIEITWHFNAASWPSAGEIWESAIGSLKKHTKKVIGEQKFTFEELSTLLAKLETCLNMRPRCPLSEDHIKRPVVKLSILPVENSDNKSITYDHENEATQQPQRTKKRFSSFLTLALSYLYFMSIITISQCAYNISSLNVKQGLYFDKISNMQLIRDKWKVVIYYDMDPYWQGVQAFEQYLKCLDNMCNNIKSKTHCESSVMQLRHSFSELNYYDQLLLTQHVDTRPARRRRGLIDGVGYVANSLFGVLDARFAEQYKHDISLLNKNEQHLANLWRNQTSVVEAEYNLLKRSEQEMDKMKKLINRHSLDIEKALNSQNKEVNYLAQFGEFTLSTITASNMLNYLKNIQEILLDTVTDIYHGRFNFHLISPKQLRNELSIISSQVPKDLSLPINNIHTDFGNIYKFLHVTTRMLREYLIFELSVPLTSRDSYEIYNIIPVPIKTAQFHIIKIIPVSELIAINLGKDSYLKVSKNDISTCQHNSDTYFCYLRKPIFHLTSENNLCDIDPTTGQCRFTTSICENEWNELTGTNKYLFFCCDKCQLRIVCENQMTIEQLNVTGIISIGHGCFLKHDKFTIYTHNGDQSVLKTKPMIYHPNLDPINDIINVSIPWDAINQTSDNRELESIAQDIKQMKEKAPVISEISYHDVHHYILIYLILGAVSSLSAFLAWKRFRKPRAVAPAPVAVTASVGARHPATAITWQEGTTPVTLESESVVDIQADGVVKCIFPRNNSANRSVSPHPRKTDFDNNPSS